MRLISAVRKQAEEVQSPKRQINKENIKVNIKVNKSLRKKKKKNATKVLSLSSFALLLGIVTLSFDSKIYTENYKLSQIQNEIMSLKSENEALEVSLINLNSIDYIYARAQELGMRPANESDELKIEKKEYFNGIQ